MREQAVVLLLAVHSIFPSFSGPMLEVLYPAIVIQVRCNNNSHVGTRSMLLGSQSDQNTRGCRRIRKGERERGESCSNRSEIQ